MLMPNQIAGSTISLEQNDEKEIVVINGCAHSGRRILKLAVSHKEINGINWFLVC